ncbi:3-oxoacyl-[acyl-carrier-protein] synthase III C-terminal domain-containing protein [Ideonella sp.]|uniref:3-oxoacyl-[acyl-carrier-protein] synthase III C-terminal domain-containing protein n=1 Tax=Ideonella sp. TaxID=1929293 RepID=UPI0035B08AAB
MHRAEAAVSSAPSFGIAAGAWFLPAERRGLDDWAAAVGPGVAGALLPSMKANGLANYHVAPQMSVEALCVAAVERLCDESGQGMADIDRVIYCHTNTTSVMAPPSSIPATLIKRFGMTRAIGHSIAQQNCASIVCALRLLRTLMWRDPNLREVLIVSADKVFGETSRNVSNYAIQSDGGLALRIRRDAEFNRIGHIAYNIDGRYYRGSAKGPELTRRYGLNYAVLAHHVIDDVIRSSGWTAADVDAVLPMNANLTAFSKVIELLGMPIDRLHSRNIGVTGHLFCCDPFLNFLDRFKDPAQVGSGNAILFASASSGVFSAVGVSRAWAGAPDAAPAFAAAACLEEAA